MSPTLADLLHEPQRMAEVPPEAVPPLMAQCAALQSVLAARLASVPANGHGKAEAAGQDRLLTVSEVADLLRVPKGYVYELARSGKLPTVRLGKYVRIGPSALRQWLAEHEQKGLDKVLSVTLNSNHDWLRGAPNPKATRTHAGSIRQARRRSLRHREPVGAWSDGHPGIGSPADPVARRPKGPQA